LGDTKFPPKVNIISVLRYQVSSGPQKSYQVL